MNETKARITDRGVVYGNVLGRPVYATQIHIISEGWNTSPVESQTQQIGRVHSKAGKGAGANEDG